MKYNIKRFTIQLFGGFFFLILFSACQQVEQDDKYPTFSRDFPGNTSEYIFGIHPLHNPQRLFEVFGPLIDYLSHNIPGTHFKLEASRNYETFDQKLYSHKFHFALPNPFQTINAIDKGYSVFAKMGDDHNFRGIILVRKDNNIKEVTDLKGKAVSYPAPTALAATMMPQYYLQSHGVDVIDDLDNRYVGSQESSIMNVYLGQTIAGATWPPPWNAFRKERPEVSDQLEVKWQTDSLPNNGLVVLPDVDQIIVNQVQELLTHLHETSEGSKILKTMELSRFEPATNTSYASVRSFVAKFSKEVRPLN